MRLPPSTSFGAEVSALTFDSHNPSLNLVDAYIVLVQENNKIHFEIVSRHSLLSSAPITV